MSLLRVLVQEGRTASGVLSDIISAAQGAPGPSLLNKAAIAPKDIDVEILEEV